MKYGASLVPFVNKFPKNTELYKLITTRPGEGVWEVKHNEKQISDVRGGRLCRPFSILLLMLYRQYADEKQSAEAFLQYLRTGSDGNAAGRRSADPKRKFPSKPPMKNTQRFMSGTTILQAGFLLTARTLTIPLCRA